MGNFLAAVTYVLANEGGATFTQAALDHGGATRYGITQATLSAYRKVTCTAADVAALQLSEARDIYQARYWTPLRLGEVTDDAVATAGLDVSALCGTGCAARLLQRAAGVTQDGVVGPLTLAALNGGSPPQLLLSIQQSLQTYLTAIATRDPSQRVWLSGWLCRAGRLLALPLASGPPIT